MIHATMNIITAPQKLTFIQGVPIFVNLLAMSNIIHGLIAQLVWMRTDVKLVKNAFPSLKIRPVVNMGTCVMIRFLVPKTLLVKYFKNKYSITVVIKTRVIERNSNASEAIFEVFE